MHGGFLVSLFKEATSEVVSTISGCEVTPHPAKLCEIAIVAKELRKR